MSIPRLTFAYATPKVRLRYKTIFASSTQGVARDLPRRSHSAAILYPYCCHTLAILKSMASLWQQYGISMASLWERRENTEGIRWLKAKNLCYLGHLCDNKKHRREIFSKVFVDDSIIFRNFAAKLRSLGVIANAVKQSRQSTSGSLRSSL